jgi:hypothetical protein
MRNNFIGLLATLAVCVTLLGAGHVLRDKGHGFALASADGHFYTASEIYALRKSLSYNPETILYMTGQDLRAALSEPGLVRRDAPVIVWQYRTERCVLDVYFETESEDAGLSSVSHFEARSREDAATKSEPYENCARDIIREQGGWRMVDVGAIYKAP